ncbi:MAG: ferrous iron transporter B [Erysipelotrichia bacterium]|nr:ferrous iron transporter B [Erysipelotrichia bacterium]NCC54703.1 ferrous iron transporter B [Erysipelotrichia bacterium]
MIKIAFVGNPNVGKSTWINYLSDASLKVANYAGVSVEAKTTDLIYKNKHLTFIDLPGIYDLEVANAEERYTKQFLLTNEVDLIVNVIDVRDLKRGLHLTAQLKKMKRPLLVLLNFTSENVSRKEMHKLSKLIKTPILYSTLQAKEEILDTMLEVKNQAILDSFDEKMLYQLKVEGAYKKYALDQYFLHPILGIVLLVLILIVSIGGIYFISTPFANMITFCFDYLNEHFITKVNTIVIVEQMIASLWFTLTSILSFLPFLYGVFFLISFLEESGYIARIAYLLDGFMHLFHLSGKSVIPLFVGFGCNVPAIMATRTIPNQKERIACALMIPFISCSAKLPIFLLFINTFFTDFKLLTLFMLYGLSIFMSLLVGAFLSIKQGKDEIFILELPSYAFPKLKTLCKRANQEVKHFLKKVSKVMIISMLVLTFLFPMLQGRSYQTFFSPLGFSESETALKSIPFGIISKENLVVYYAQKKGEQALPAYIQSLWKNPHVKLKALCYLLYLAMSIPCIMTLATLRSEFGGKVLLLSLLIMFIVPYFVSLIAYQGILFFQSFF